MSRGTEINSRTRKPGFARTMQVIDRATPALSLRIYPAVWMGSTAADGAGAAWLVKMQRFVDPAAGGLLNGGRQRT